MLTEPLILTISLFLSQAIFALIFTYLVKGFYRDHNNKFFYFWILSWGSLAVQLIGSSVVSIEGLWFPFDHPVSLVVVYITTVCSYFQILFLFVGFYELAFRKHFPANPLKITVFFLLVFSAVLVMLYFNDANEQALRQLFRLGVKEFFCGLFFSICAFLIFQYRRGSLAMKFVMVSFLLYGSAQFHYFYYHLTLYLNIDYLNYPFYLGVIDLFLIVFIGIGLVMTVLELESRRLSHVNKELDVFLYRSAHDLRAPLMGVKGLLGLMNDQSNDKELETLAKGEIEKTSHVIEEIITLRQNQKRPLTISKLSIQSVIDQVILELSQKIDIPGSFDFQSGLDGMELIYTDPERIYQVLYQLLANAVLYRKVSNNCQFIKLAYKSTSSGVIISIEDNGQGIDERFLPHVLDMFYRINRQSKGPGLGLYVVNEIMFQLQGSIELKSEFGKGTIVIIELKSLEQATEAINFPRYD